MQGQNRRDVFLGLLSVAGCTSITVERNGLSAFPTDYIVGAVYATRQDLLIERAGTLADRFVLKSPRQISHAHAPSSFAEYQADPPRWPTVRGVLPSGTRLRISRLARRGPWFGLEAVGEVYAEILGGPHVGLTVELSFISRNVDVSEPPIRAQWVDPAELERVDAP